MKHKKIMYLYINTYINYVLIYILNIINIFFDTLLFSHQGLKGLKGSKGEPIHAANLPGPPVSILFSMQQY